MQELLQNKYLILFGMLLIIYTFVLICLKIIRFLKRNSLKYIDKMDGEEFEDWLASQFSKQGYIVSLTPQSHDYGADLILEHIPSSDSEDKTKIIVQAKRYSGKVPVAAIQQVFAAMYFYDGTDCIVITNSYFTEPAMILAKKIGVTLWNRDDMLKNFKINE